jgi:hypothetical protein
MIMLDSKNAGPASGGTFDAPAKSDDFSQPQPPSSEDEIQVENIPF